MLKTRSFLQYMFGRPRNPHSLDNLKYLHNVLVKNPIVSEQNRALLVETLRLIAEILIWGDQNDSSVFDFFLEKNMLSFFLKIMEQRNGGSSYVCVQLLQTLNILFENIRNETSLYYLLSNNHVNSIILHKFDFSDEEVMAYYISFLKTLSLKLNSHTIHFFYSELSNDFPLYTEAIKFFNHSESMVRIAVRTLTLNVYKVPDKNMLRFIRDRTAAPYFSNIVSFIVKHILELDYCVQNYSDRNSRNRVRDLVAEHLDYLHYLNDILLLQIDELNSVLINYLLMELFVPFYIYSLVYEPVTDANNLLAAIPEDDCDHNLNMYLTKTSESFRISYSVALFLLSQVFLIISNRTLIAILDYLLLKCDHLIFKQSFESLIETLLRTDNLFETITGSLETFRFDFGCDRTVERSTMIANDQNRTDEEKVSLMVDGSDNADVSVSKKHPVFIEVIIRSISFRETDHVSLLALCLLHAISNHKCVPSGFFDRLFYKMCQDDTNNRNCVYNEDIVENLLSIVTSACQKESLKIRPITLELALKLVLQIVREKSALSEQHRAVVYATRAQCMASLRNLYNHEMFLDMFEFEYNEMIKSPLLNVEYLCMDSTMVLPPTSTPLTGIDFVKRLPCGDVEKMRRSIRNFFLIRRFYLELCHEAETKLPLIDSKTCVKVNDKLNLENKDLIACVIVYRSGERLSRFLAFDAAQVIIVEPESSLGVGKATLVGFLQDVECHNDKDDSCALHITIHKPLSNTYNGLGRKPLLAAKFFFHDHIRSMAAKQHLTSGRIRARQKKLQSIAHILEIPSSYQTGTLYGTSSSSAMMATGSSGSPNLKIALRNYGRIFNEPLNFLQIYPQQMLESRPADYNESGGVTGRKSRDSSASRLKNRERSKSRSSRDSSPKTLIGSMPSETIQMMRIAPNELNQMLSSSPSGGGMIAAAAAPAAITMATNVPSSSEETSFIAATKTASTSVEIV